MEIGAALGSVVPGLGTVVGAGIGFLAGELIGGGIEWLMNGGLNAKGANGQKGAGEQKGIGGALSGGCRSGLVSGDLSKCSRQAGAYRPH